MKPLLILLCAVVWNGCASKPKVPAPVPNSEVPKTDAEWNQHMEFLAKSMAEGFHNTKGQLLHQTDHRAVLAASREVMRTRRAYSRDPKWFGPDSGPEESLIAADDSKLPTAIRSLHAVSIFGYDDHLVLEFGGGFHHQGFVAYAETVTNFPGGAEGFQKVIDGLWFYEDTH
jgi:hypothetical protein